VIVRLLVATSLLALAGSAVHGLCAPRDAAYVRYEFEQPHMGTMWRIVLYASAEDVASEAARLAFARIAELDARLSDYKPDSELMRLEKEGIERPVRVSSDLFTVLSTAQTLSAQTGGAFDVTAGALTRLWRRARRLGVLPAQTDVDAAKAVSGYERMSLDPSARMVRLSRGVRLDVGGIAKGFAADEVLVRLRARGVTRALVAGGGDIAAGDAPPGSPGWVVDTAGWHDHPASRASVILNRSAVSTSGDTEQWLEAGGVRYSHVLDPRTGIALTEGRLVTVIAPDAITSDMLATAASVLTAAEALRLVESIPGVAVRIGIRAASGDVRWTTSGTWARHATNAEQTTH
jgi:thiamine biosynthesis lipoprotein